MRGALAPEVIHPNRPTKLAAETANKLFG